MFQKPFNFKALFESSSNLGGCHIRLNRDRETHYTSLGRAILLLSVPYCVLFISQIVSLQESK
jgi:hypothetical protein